MELLADKMAGKARRETGYQRDEALRCEKAVRAFMATMRPRMFAKMKISSSPSTLSLKKWGVRLKVTMDASITLDDGDTTNSGGIVMLYAFSADRGELKEHLAAITGLLLWALEGGQMEPLPRLCMAADIAEGKIVKASASHTRFRQYVTNFVMRSRRGGIPLSRLTIMTGQIRAKIQTETLPACAPPPPPPAECE